MQRIVLLQITLITGALERRATVTTFDGFQIESSGLVKFTWCALLPNQNHHNFNGFLVTFARHFMQTKQNTMNQVNENYDSKHKLSEEITFYARYEFTTKFKERGFPHGNLITLISN